MADEENESRPGDEKPEVKDTADSAIESNETVDNDKESEQEQESTAKDEPDAAKKEEKSPKKVEKEKDQKDDKIVKKEKAKKKEETEDEDEDGDEDDDDDEESLPPGLLERPLEVEGKREKKKVERLSASMISSPPEKKKLEIEKGTGKKLGDIPYIEHQLNVTKAIDLKPLHRVLFLRVGSNNEIKKNIKQFSGFTHGKDSKEHEKRIACLNKLVLAELKAICVALGLERGGTKVNLVDRVMDFLMKPKDKGLNVKMKTKKKSKSTGGKTKGTKRKRSKEPKKKGKASKDDDSPGSDSDEEEEEEEEEQEEEEEEESEEEEEESEDEAPKKKKAKTENKKPTPKKSVKENGKKEKPTPKKETKKPKPAAKKKPAIEESDSMSEDSEDEPIAKMKKSPPSNAEIKDLVKKILDGADLETVTMKTVVKQVYAKYPSFDLSDRKDFIKDTVREVIS